MSFKKGLLFCLTLLFLQTAYTAEQKCADVFVPTAASTKSTDSSQERIKLYRSKLEEIWSAESQRKAGDLLHSYWQETNPYNTRYKPMKDESGQPVRDIELYVTKHSIPAQYASSFYRKNKDGFFEEDIKAIPNTFLAPNNSAENSAGAKSALRLTIKLLVAAPKTDAEAAAIISEALQRIHSDWFARNSWAKGSYPEQAHQLSADLQITNAVPLMRLFANSMQKADPYHARINRALENHFAELNAKRVARFKDLSVEDAYVEMISEKGLKVQIDPVLENFFDSKLKHKQLSKAPPDSGTAAEKQGFYAEELKVEVSQSFGLTRGFTLKAPSTAPGSGAQVFLIKSESGEVVGALKIQSKKANGLDELLSSLAVSRFLKSERKGVKHVGVVDYGLLSDNSYFIIIEPAKTKDLDSWLGSSMSQAVDQAILSESARATAALHTGLSGENGITTKATTPNKISSETRQIFKGNALYDVRKVKDFAKSGLLTSQASANAVSSKVTEVVLRNIHKVIFEYEKDLENNLEKFRPTTSHGDYHGGNLFFNDATRATTVIDYGSITWTMAKKNQPGTGDPANDLGRMLGHLLIEDLKAGKLGAGTQFRIKEFYSNYLTHAGLKKGSVEEQVLFRSLLFYVNRYFAVQLSDVKGTKFSSKVYERAELIRRLFDLWAEVDTFFAEI